VAALQALDIRVGRIISCEQHPDADRCARWLGACGRSAAGLPRVRVPGCMCACAAASPQYRLATGAAAAAAAARHTAHSLYVEKIDVGEPEPRTIVSG
jgi:hypothetical protein